MAEDIRFTSQNSGTVMTVKGGLTEKLSRSAGWGGTASLNKLTNKVKEPRYNERLSALSALVLHPVPVRYRTGADQYGAPAGVGRQTHISLSAALPFLPQYAKMQ